MASPFPRNARSSPAGAKRNAIDHPLLAALLAAIHEVSEDPQVRVAVITGNGAAVAALMQEVTGFERAVGGAENDPVAATWSRSTCPEGGSRPRECRPACTPGWPAAVVSAWRRACSAPGCCRRAACSSATANACAVPASTRGRGLRPWVPHLRGKIDALLAAKVARQLED